MVSAVMLWMLGETVGMLYHGGGCDGLGLEMEIGGSVVMGVVMEMYTNGMNGKLPRDSLGGFSPAASGSPDHRSRPRLRFHRLRLLQLHPRRPDISPSASVLGRH